MTGTTTESFVKSYEEATGKKLTKDTDPNEFKNELNNPCNVSLKKMFRELTKTTPEQDVAAGMAGMFG